MTILPNPFISALDPAMGAETAAAPDLTDHQDAAADRFQLDEARFLEEIEPLPLFLQAPAEVLHILAGHLR
jgi:hypothetical protein